MTLTSPQCRKSPWRQGFLLISRRPSHQRPQTEFGSGRFSISSSERGLFQSRNCRLDSVRKSGTWRAPCSAVHSSSGVFELWLLWSVAFVFSHSADDAVGEVGASPGEPVTSSRRQSGQSGKRRTRRELDGRSLTSSGGLVEMVSARKQGVST
jgi:hypothetical protein